ncbi:MAG TPA: hypothetical protein VL172_06540, partial [Kofleriaceae bacterium]|nr:hypothetical protein [Kofleriaceae bacterium]
QQAAGPGGGVKSQLRGYDLGPPFPAGLRDSGLVNGYAEGEWIPFVAVMDGRKLEDADAAAGDAGDGAYRATIILPTYSPRHDANGISDLQVVGTYGLAPIAPIPSPFDDQWLIDNGMDPFVLGAYPDAGATDLAPVISDIGQRSGPTRFGGDVASAAVTVDFALDPAATHVELRFAVRLAPPSLQAIAPGGQGFPGTAAGTALGAADFFPGPGPLFVGYQVGDPTGIATVPIRVDRHSCESEDDCLPGEICGPGGGCVPPCETDAECPTDEICEDGVCQPPPPPCTTDDDCQDDDVYDVCNGGYCVPPCPESCGDPEFCDPDPCIPPGDEPPPCVSDAQCPGDDVCEDGLCQPPEPPCDVSCPVGEICQDGVCVPPEPPCTTDSDCPGGELCAGGHCRPGEPPCDGDCAPCTIDEDCPGGQGCEGGVCVDLEPPLPCSQDVDCPTGQTCEGGYCTPPDNCGPQAECGPGELCETDTGTCEPEHPPVPCTTASDCPPNSDDVYTDVCYGGFCTPPDGGPGTPCKNVHDCDTGLDCIGHVCTPPAQPPCAGDYDCDADEVCSGGLCVPLHPPVPCTAASDCPAPGDECISGWCEPPQGCTGDYDCPGGELCDDGHCRPGQPPTPCTVDSDCPPGTDDVYPDVCYGGFCTPSGPSCNDPADCPGGQTCVSPGVCVDADPPQACQTSYDCGGTGNCEGGFCVPTDPGSQCETASDCPHNSNDDVYPVQCINGLCTASRVAGLACASAADCSPGSTCIGGACVAITGACNLDADCTGDDTCIDGWCGQACTANDDCGMGQNCSLGRCGAVCITYQSCPAFDVCLGATCVPLHAALSAGHGGDADAWAVDVPGEGGGGGCSASGGTTMSPLLLIALLGLRRRGRRRRVALSALLAIALPLALLACSGNADESGPPDAAPAPDAPTGVPQTPTDGGASSPFWLVTCPAAAPAPVYDIDAGADADAGAGDADAGAPVGIDEPCCQPDGAGACPGDLACIRGPSGDQYRCRPPCDLADGTCPDGGVCADFGGAGVCIPASTVGLPCAPELCDGSSLCVGHDADDALCYLRCTDGSECADGETCTPVNPSSSSACLPAGW